MDRQGLSTLVSRPIRVPRFLILPGVSAGLLCATALLVARGLRGLAVVVACVALSVLPVAFRRHLPTLFERRQRPSPRRVARAAWEMLLYLSPIALLSVAYPIATHRLVDMDIGGVPVTTLLLASSVTVPWMTQGVCLPLYRAVGPLMAAGEYDQITERLVEVWPTTFLQTMPVVLLFAVPIQMSMHWSWMAIGTYLGLCLLYLAFAQSLILSIVYRRRGLWAIGWLVLAVALVAAPTLWFLPPLLGLATQLVPLRRYRGALRHPVRLAFGAVVTDVVRGLLLGAVLWSDKYFLFLKAGDGFAVTTVYLALLPAVLAFNYYFVRLAPGFDASIIELRRAMESAPYDVLIEQSQSVYRRVTRSLSRSALVGAAIAFSVTFVLTVVRPDTVGLFAAVAIASWLAMMLTLFCYKLDYIGQRGIAQLFSGAYLVGCAAAFAFLPVGPAPFVALIGFDVVLFALTLRTTLEHWRSPEYSLFWRYATAW